MSDLGRVYTKLYNARAKWFDVGLALGMNFETLKSIEKEQLKNQSDCLREMLAHCIQSGCSLTWAKLCSCLRHPTVERIDLAEIIEQGMCVFELMLRNTTPFADYVEASALPSIASRFMLINLY